MPAAVRTEIKKSIDKTAGEIVSDMKAAAPRKTGALARSIGYTFGEYTPDNSSVRGVATKKKKYQPRQKVKDKDLSATIHAGDKEAWYAALAEFGTVKTKAQPFFMPTMRLWRKRALSSIRRATSKAIKTIMQKGGSE